VKQVLRENAKVQNPEHQTTERSAIATSPFDNRFTQQFGIPHERVQNLASHRRKIHCERPVYQVRLKIAVFNRAEMMSRG
jgi:hypothetical protein